MSDPFTSMLLSGMQLPGSSDVRVRDVMPGQKRSIGTAQDFAESIWTSVAGKRFAGDSLLAPLRSSVPDQLARGLTVVNTGLSTTSSQTDEIITQLVFAKPYPRAWEQGFVEKTPLFCNRVEPYHTTSGQIFTVADPPIINFATELKYLTSTANSIVRRGAVSEELAELVQSMDYMTADTAQEAADKWNFLGPMTTFQDAGIHSSNAAVRFAQRAQRQLGYSVFNRAHVFNTFSDHVRPGDHMWWIFSEVDISHLKNLVDPLGNSIVARSIFPARALQLIGFSEKDSPYPMHCTSYDPVAGPESFSDPVEGDLDYMKRAHRIAQDYSRMRYDPETGSIKRVITGEVPAGDPFYLTPEQQELIKEKLAETPEIVYNAYMEGIPKKVGVARHLTGRDPSMTQIREGLRSQTKMKLLQTVEIYKGM